MLQRARGNDVSAVDTVLGLHSWVDDAPEGVTVPDSPAALEYFNMLVGEKFRGCDVHYSFPAYNLLTFPLRPSERGLCSSVTVLVPKAMNSVSAWLSCPWHSSRLYFEEVPLQH